MQKFKTLATPRLTVFIGGIVLLHDGDGYDPLGDRSQTAESLDRIVSALRDRGYEFTTLPDIDQ